MMTVTEQLLLSEICEIKAKLEAFTPSTSPWIKGDQKAAEWCGYKTRPPFLRLMKKIGVKPRVDDGCNFWSKAKIEKAIERQG